MAGALIGMGANLGDRQRNLAAALEALGALPHTQVKAVSHLYETEPVGYRDQPAFLNAAALLETGLSARALLGACLGIEAALGRRRTVRNGPRVIDLDLLLMEGVQSDDPELILPHPRMAERAFVLIPVRDLFPDWQVWGWDFRTAGERCDAAGARFFGDFPAGKNF